MYIISCPWSSIHESGSASWEKYAVGKEWKNHTLVYQEECLRESKGGRIVDLSIEYVPVFSNVWVATQSWVACSFWEAGKGSVKMRFLWSLKCKQAMIGDVQIRISFPCTDSDHYRYEYSSDTYNPSPFILFTCSFSTQDRKCDFLPLRQNFMCLWRREKFIGLKQVTASLPWRLTYASVAGSW